MDPGNFDAVAKLAWTKRAEKKPRFGIRASDREEIARQEGLPLAVDGYIARARWEGKESCNCKSDEPEMRDIHLLLTKEPTRDRSESIVVEVTPRLRAKHAHWTISSLKRIAERHERVRIRRLANVRWRASGSGGEDAGDAVGDSSGGWGSRRSEARTGRS